MNKDPKWVGLYSENEYTKLYKGDVEKVLSMLLDNSVNTVITSPPYWLQRDYLTGEWRGGDPNCSHKRDSKKSDYTTTGHKNFDEMGGIGDAIYRSLCPRCGAIRIDEQIGLEPSPELYVTRMVRIFREVWRVLKPDGTVWLNLGDTYIGGGRGSGKSNKQNSNRGTVDMPGSIVPPGYKQKDLAGIPWRTALALQADGWWLRQDIIWHKENPMPEPVRDRCTKSHEYVFLLSKSGEPKFWIHRDKKYSERVWTKPEPDYCWKDKLNENVETKVEPPNWETELLPKHKIRKRWSRINLWIGCDYYFDNESIREPIKESNKGSVMGRVKLKEGVLANDGSEWERERRNYEKIKGANKRSVWTLSTKPYRGAHFATFSSELITPMILAGCPKDGVVLDPFVGSGTTCAVAKQYGRKSIGIDLNEKYLELARKRIDEVKVNFDMGFDL